MLKSLLLLAFPGLLLAADLTAQVRDLPMLVDAEWLASNLDVPELLVVQVDATREAYDAGHIPGAAFLPYDRLGIDLESASTEMPMVEMMILPLMNLGMRDDSYVVLYGGPLATSRVWMILDYMGKADRVGILDGGVDAWTAAGNELAATEPLARRGGLQIYPVRQRVVEAEWVQGQLGDPATLLIDTRSPEEFSGADGGRAGQYRPGHIPGARNIFWEDLIRSVEDQRFLPEEELRAIFEAAGATPDTSVVVYGLNGVQASPVYFASRLLGYDTRMYDRSWPDWSSRDIPVETGQ